MQNNRYKLIQNEDGTLTLHIPEGVRSTRELFSVIGQANGALDLDIPEELCSAFGERPWKIYENTSIIYFPASMECITECLDWRFSKLKTIHIHPENNTFTLENGVLFSKNKKKIIRYLGEDKCDTYRIEDCVEEIAEGCFAGAKDLKHIYIGKNVRKIGSCGLRRDGCDLLEKIYIPPTVTELNGEIFDSGGADGGMYYPVEIVGGAAGSVIEEYCNERGIDFIVVSEDAVDDFYATSVDDLRERLKKQIEYEKAFFVDDPENGYQAKFCDGVLEVFGPNGTAVVKDTRRKINNYRRQKVKRIVIGRGIAKIADLAFDDYENLESVFIGADVCKIGTYGFNGQNHSDSYGCRKLASIVVDEKNKWYTAIDGVLYTHDMQTLVKYSPAKPELYHEVDSRVRHIAEFAFEYANTLQCLKVGKGCVSVGHAAFLNAEALRHAYFADSVTEWPERFPFVGEWGFERPYYLDLVIGGNRDSFIQKYCADEGVHFLEIENEQIRDFLKTPLPNEDDDPYMAKCLKVMIVDRNGVLQQLGEVGEELILPEGVVRTRFRMDLSGCKKVVIHSTMQSLWTHGFGGPAKELKEFIVAGENETYQSVDGHLYRTDGTLLTYAPAADRYGVLPEETVAIDKEAFCLLPSPFEKVYIPSSVENIEPCWDEWFYEAEVAHDNPFIKSIDGSIFSADGKMLVCAKLSLDGYIVPDGTETICDMALCQVHGTVFIPGSVTKIENAYGLGRHITGICTPMGSCAEAYAQKHHIPVELV